MWLDWEAGCQTEKETRKTDRLLWMVSQRGAAFINERAHVCKHLKKLKHLIHFGHEMYYIWSWKNFFFKIQISLHSLQSTCLHYVSVLKRALAVLILDGAKRHCNYVVLWITHIIICQIALANVEFWGNAQREKAMYQLLFTLLLLEPLDSSLVFSFLSLICTFLKIHVRLPAVIYRLIRWAEQEHWVESKTKSHFNFVPRYHPFSQTQLIFSCEILCNFYFFGTLDIFLMKRENQSSTWLSDMHSVTYGHKQILISIKGSQPHTHTRQ